MTTPKIKIAKLIRIYNNASAADKALLIDACGAEIFASNVMDRVKTIRDACDECGKDFDIEFSPERIKWETPDETAYREMKILCEALNEGEEIDYSNSNQRKYYIWVKWVSGRGLALGAVYFDITHTVVGPRLVFISEERARYAFAQFPDTYKNFFNNQKNK